jgi:phosphoribosyl 1,2-cyclic phosphodiesterase
MNLKFWGVRGSICSPLDPDQYREKIEKILELSAGKDLSSADRKRSFIDSLPYGLRTTYGGNTSCVTIDDGEDLLIFDAGTGIRKLGGDLLAGRFFNKKKKEYNIFFSHLHLDHINGLPFFSPVHFKDVQINFYSHHKGFEKMLELQQNGSYFPISLESRPCKMNFYELEEKENVSIGSFKISSMRLNHPNGSYSYRVTDASGMSVVYATDGEYTANSVLNHYFEFFNRADILIFDSQYNFNELAQRYNYGHSTAEIGVDAAVNSNVKKLVLYHHNHENNDEKIASLYYSALKYRSEKYPGSDLEIIISNEGMEIKL